MQVQCICKVMNALNSVSHNVNFNIVHSLQQLQKPSGLDLEAVMRAFMQGYIAADLVGLDQLRVFWP